MRFKNTLNTLYLGYNFVRKSVLKYVNEVKIISNKYSNQLSSMIIK